MSANSWLLASAIGTLGLNGILALYLICRHRYLTIQEEKARKLQEFLDGRG